jgi:hypothetical protein
MTINIPQIAEKKRILSRSEKARRRLSLDSTPYPEERSMNGVLLGLRQNFSWHPAGCREALVASPQTADRGPQAGFESGAGALAAGNIGSAGGPKWRMYIRVIGKGILRSSRVVPFQDI